MDKLNDVTKIFPLLDDVIFETALVYSVVENTDNGDIYVDDVNNPNYALIVTKVNYLFLIGNYKIGDHLEDFIFDKIVKDEMILFTYNNKNRELLHNTFKNHNVIIIDRKLFKYNLNHIPKVNVPENYKIIDIDNILANKIGLDLTICDFNKDHFGKCLMKDNEIISYCYSLFVTSYEVEIDVKTIESYRNQGFSTLVTKAFIEECLNRNIIPNWACWPYNEPSIKLALKVGFLENGYAKAHYWAKNM